MRNDMHKILCERPRFHDGYDGEAQFNKHNLRNLRLVHYCDEDGEGIESSALKRAPMSRGRGTKHLSENLKPLYRWLETKVGCHWDDVYSELRQNIDTRSAVRLHALQHLWGYVRRYTVVKDGRVYDNDPQYRRGCFGEYELRNNELFIHPETKILTRYKKQPEPKKEIPCISIKINEKIYLCKLSNGLWYEIDFAIVPLKKGFRKGLIHPDFFDPKAMMLGKDRRWRFVYDLPLSYKKRQLSKKELRKHKIQNG